MLTREQILAMSDREALTLLQSIEDARGWPIRVLTRGDADGITESYDVPNLTDEEFNGLRASNDWKQLGNVSDEDWDCFTSIVMEVTRQRPDFVDLDARGKAVRA